MAVYGYCRVSTREQNEDRQLIAMREYGILNNHIFTDKQSGKDFNRKNYIKITKILKSGDVLVIKSIDRLGRNYKEILEEWRMITKIKKADIVVLDMPLLNTANQKDLVGTLISDIVLQLLSYVAENERINIRQRQSEGIAAAKERGVKFGRPKKQLPANYKDILLAYKEGKICRQKAMWLLNVCQSTFYNLYREYNKLL